MGGASITRRIALLFGAVSAAGFLALGSYLSAALERHFMAMDRQTLAAAASRIQRVIGRSLAEAPGYEGLHARLDALMAGHDRVSMWLRLHDGRPVVVDAPMAYPAAQAAPLFASGGAALPALFSWQAPGGHYRGLALHISVPQGAPLDALVAISIEPHERFMALFRRAMWVSVAGAILVASLLGMAIARSGLRPMRRLTDLARRVSTERLGERLDTTNLPEELTELAQAFNEMLERLDDAFRRLSNFSSDIAHELRTPLSNLLTQTQVVLSRSRSVEEYRDVLASNAEELERMSRMAADMLFLAKADNGLVLPESERVDLRVQVEELFEFYEALAEEKGVTLVLHGTAVVDGDRLMLRRALNNLLSNALRHTPRHGRIRVALKKHADRVTASVTNTGTPIGPVDLDHLFDRFYRADSSRTRNGEGAGLGLAITRSIVRAHGGSAEVRAEADGNTFVLTFPLAPPRRPDLRPGTTPESTDDQRPSRRLAVPARK
ncbi:MAG: heavy metal sensor histidine kinase [Betaproteobacteria bacterium]|nr:heavy metal sensor histidine kinase [Betaproteobacteria bacterium]